METSFPPGWYLPTQNPKGFCWLGFCVFVVADNTSELYAMALRLPANICQRVFKSQTVGFLKTSRK